MTKENSIQTTKETPRIRVFMQVLWPGFFAAGVLVALLFSAVDPNTVELFQEYFSESREAAYTMTFLVTWMVVSAACATTFLLTRQ